MPNYGAWGAIAEAGDSFKNAYMQAKALRQQQDAAKTDKANKSALLGTEMAKNIYQAGGPAYEPPTAPSNDIVPPPESDMPMPGKSQLPLLPQMGDRSNRTTGMLEQGNPETYA